MRKTGPRPPLRWLATLLILIQLVTPLLCGAGVLSHAPDALAEGGLTHGHAGHGADEHEAGHGHGQCAEVSVCTFPRTIRPADAQARARSGPTEDLPSPSYDVPPPIPIFS